MVIIRQATVEDMIKMQHCNLRNLPENYIEILSRLKKEYNIKTNSKMILKMIKEFESAKMISKNSANHLMETRTKLSSHEKLFKKISFLSNEMNLNLNSVENEEDFY